jgi:hypothetical protein
MFENGSYCKASVCVVGLRHTMKISITPINRDQHSADLALTCNKITHKYIFAVCSCSLYIILRKCVTINF